MKKIKNNRINNSLWIIFDLGLFCFAVVFDSATAWLPFYFMTFFLAINALSVMQTLDKIDFAYPEACILNFGSYGVFTVGLSRKDRKLFFPKITAKIGFTNQTLVCCASGFFPTSTLNLDFNLTTMPRGIYPIHGLEITVQDVFGMFKKSITLSLDAKVLVLPKYNYDDAQAIMTYILNQDKVALTEHDLVGFDIKNIRDYQSGDRLNSIDWKLSSKKQNLMVKEFDLDLEDEVEFIFLGEPAKEFEPILSVFYTIYDAYLTDPQTSIRVISDDFVDDEVNPSTFASVQAINNDDTLSTRLMENLRVDTRKFVFSTLLSVELEALMMSHEAFNKCIIFQREIDGTLIAYDHSRVNKVPKGGI